MQGVVFATFVWEQPPAPQVPAVHGLLSSQFASLATFEQPVAGAHESFVHATLSSQSSAVPGTQTPMLVLQVSTPLHASESSHWPLVVQPTVHVPAWHNPLLPAPFMHGVPFMTLAD